MVLETARSLYEPLDEKWCCAVHLSFGSCARLRVVLNSLVLVCFVVLTMTMTRMPRLILEIETLASHERVIDRWPSLSFTRKRLFLCSLYVGHAGEA